MTTPQHLVYCAFTLILLVGAINAHHGNRYSSQYLTHHITCPSHPSTRNCAFCWCAMPLTRNNMPSALNQNQIQALNTFRDWFVNDGQSADTLYDRTVPVFELTSRQKQAILDEFSSFFQRCENFDQTNQVCLDPPQSSRITRSTGRICSVVEQTTPYFAALTEGDDPIVVVQISLEIVQEFDEELCASQRCNYYSSCVCNRNFRLARAIVYNTEQRQIYTPTIGDIKVRSCHAYRE